jgi:hypothetical protein
MNFLRILGIFWNLVAIALGILLALGVVPDSTFFFLLGILIFHSYREIVEWIKL